MVVGPDLNLDEQKAFTELKKRLLNDLPSSVTDDTNTLYKFLKARNFNVNHAEAMLRKNVEWRRSLRVDTINTYFTVPEVIKLYMSQELIGYSKKGCPVRYTDLGNLDIKGLFRSANHIDVLRSSIQKVESDIKNMRLLSEKLGIPVTQSILIYNLENLTLAKATNRRGIDYFMNGISIFQDNYPEHLKSIYILNASVYFTIGFAAIKKILADSIIGKIKVFGQDYKEALLEEIDADVLPAFLGGNRTDPDGNPMCNTFLKHGRPIPESYYQRRMEPQAFRQKAGTRRLVVERHSAAHVEVHVQAAGSLLEWRFQTKCHDVGFGLQFGGSFLIPVHKMDTDYQPEHGTYRCEKRGVYTLVFDNTYSWLHSKEVYYKTTVTSPKNEKHQGLRSTTQDIAVSA